MKQGRRTSSVITQQPGKFCLKVGVVFSHQVSLSQPFQWRHQSFGDKPSAIGSPMAQGIWFCFWCGHVVYGWSWYLVWGGLGFRFGFWVLYFVLCTLYVVLRIPAVCSCRLLLPSAPAP